MRNRNDFPGVGLHPPTLGVLHPLCACHCDAKAGTNFRICPEQVLKFHVKGVVLMQHSVRSDLNFWWNFDCIQFGLSNKCAISGIFYFPYFRLFNFSIEIKQRSITGGRWLDSNCGSLVLEATALPNQHSPTTAHVEFLSCLTYYWHRKQPCILESFCE